MPDHPPTNPNPAGPHRWRLDPVDLSLIGSLLLHLALLALFVLLTDTHRHESPRTGDPDPPPIITLTLRPRSVQPTALPGTANTTDGQPPLQPEQQSPSAELDAAPVPAESQTPVTLARIETPDHGGNWTQTPSPTLDDDPAAEPPIVSDPDPAPVGIANPSPILSHPSHPSPSPPPRPDTPDPATDPAPPVPRAQTPPPSIPTPAPDSPSPVAAPASVLHVPTPIYPRLSRERGQTGWVELEIEVLPDGTAGDIRVLRDPGHRRLLQAALDAARLGRYTPATLNGKPIASTLTVSFRFELR